MAFAGVVGKDWVMAGDADGDAYADVYARPAGAVAGVCRHGAGERR